MFPQKFLAIAALLCGSLTGPPSTIGLRGLSSRVVIVLVSDRLVFPWTHRYPRALRCLGYVRVHDWLIRS